MYCQVKTLVQTACETHNLNKILFHLIMALSSYAWVKVFRIIPEFRVLRLTFHRKSASKC